MQPTMWGYIKMCLLCVELAKGTMRAPDIIRNFSELANTDPDHAEEVAEKYETVIVSGFFEQDDFGELDLDFFYHSGD